MARLKDTQKIDPKEIYDYLVNEKGLSHQHATGMIANIQAESGFNPSVTNSIGAVGLFQYLGPRKEGLVKYTDGNWQDWRRQIDYAMTEGATKKYLSQTFNSSGDAASWFTINWERPENKEEHAKKRAKYAAEFDYTFSGVQDTGGSSQGNNQTIPMFDRHAMQVPLGDPNNPDAFTEVNIAELEEEIDKYKEVEQRLENSPEMQAIENKKQFLAEMEEDTPFIYDTPQPQYQQQQEDPYAFLNPESYQPRLQPLPQLFQTGLEEFKEGGEYQEPTPAQIAMMKARLAYAHMHGNPAAQRMVSGTDNPYIFPDGSHGTHYMASMDTSAVPQIQYDENGNPILGDFGPQSPESFMFDSEEDAQAFAEYYKAVASAMQNFQDGGVYQDGGTVSDIYTRTTGKAWSTAKEEGLTDGSYEQNIALRSRLLTGEFGEVPVQSNPSKEWDGAAYDKKVREMYSQGKSLDYLIEKKIGTKEGLQKRFPDLFMRENPRKQPIIKDPVIPKYSNTQPEPTKELPPKKQPVKVKLKAKPKGETFTEKVLRLAKEQNIPQKLQTSQNPFDVMKEFVRETSPIPKKQSEWGIESAQEMLRISKGFQPPKSKNSEPPKTWLTVPENFNQEVYIQMMKDAGLGPEIMYSNMQKIGMWIDEKGQQARRFLEKKGVVATPEEKFKPKQPEPTKELPPNTYERIGYVKDNYDKNSRLLSYRNEWNNAEGFVYYATPVKKDRKNTDYYENVEGVAHFLLDASADPRKPYSHEYNKKLIENAKKDNKWLPVFEDEGNGYVRLRYKKPNNITKKDNVITPLRQFNFDDIDFNKTKQAKGFKKGINAVTTKSGQGIYLLFKDRDGYSRFSGGSVVFIWEDKNGNVRVRDFAGTLNQIKKEGESITKTHGLKEGQLTLGYHDVGSFSAKPAADDNGVLRAQQWSGFNNKEFTGGALLIPRK